MAIPETSSEHVNPNLWGVYLTAIPETSSEQVNSNLWGGIPENII